MPVRLGYQVQEVLLAGVRVTDAHAGVRRPPAAWRSALAMAIYHLIFVLAFVVYAPILAWRMILNPSYRTGILQRMGRVPRTESGRPVVWIHGVSVGEIKAAGVNPVSKLEWSDHIPADWPAKTLLWMCSPEADGFMGEEISLRDEGIRKQVGLI